MVRTRSQLMAHRSDQLSRLAHCLRRWRLGFRSELARPATDDAPPEASAPTADSASGEAKPVSRLHAASAWLHVTWQLVVRTVDQFSVDRGALMAAAVAFYALLSIAPLAMIAVAVAGTVLGSGRAHYQLAAVLRQSMGPNAERTVMDWVNQAANSAAAGSIIGVLLTVWAASRLFGQLREALNQIWNVEVPESSSIRDSVKDYARRQLFAIAMVFVAGPLLLASFASRALLSNAYGWVGASAGALVQVGQFVVSLVLIAATTAIVFKVVPDVNVDWHSVLVGSSLTSVLLNAGNYLVGLYLGRASVADTYGAAGSAVVVLLWLYFSAQIFLLGAEFTQVYAVQSGRDMKPKHPQSARRSPMHRFN